MTTRDGETNMDDSTLLAGKVALVTGAGGGIGREIAVAMANAGAAVLINDIGVSLTGEGGSGSPAEQTRQIIEQRGGRAAARAAARAVACAGCACGGGCARRRRRWR